MALTVIALLVQGREGVFQTPVLRKGCAGAVGEVGGGVQACIIPVASFFLIMCYFNK